MSTDNVMSVFSGSLMTFLFGMHVSISMVFLALPHLQVFIYFVPLVDAWDPKVGYPFHEFCFKQAACRQTCIRHAVQVSRTGAFHRTENRVRLISFKLLYSNRHWVLPWFRRRWGSGVYIFVSLPAACNTPWSFQVPVRTPGSCVRTLNSIIGTFESCQGL